MWSLETSCSPASLFYSPSIYPSFSVSLLLFTFHPLVTLVLCICFLLLLLWHFVHLTQLSCSCTFLNLIGEKIAKRCLASFSLIVMFHTLFFYFTHACHFAYFILPLHPPLSLNLISSSFSLHGLLNFITLIPFSLLFFPSLCNPSKFSLSLVCVNFA